MSLAGLSEYLFCERTNNLQRRKAFGRWEGNGEGVSDGKTFPPPTQSNLQLCEILFSSESYLYLGALKEFSNFMPVTVIQAHLSKINKPSCSINYAAAEEPLQQI